MLVSIEFTPQWIIFFSSLPPSLSPRSFLLSLPLLPLHPLLLSFYSFPTSFPSFLSVSGFILCKAKSLSSENNNNKTRSKQNVLSFFFGNIFNLKSGIFIFPNKCIYHVSYHKMKRDFLRNLFAAKIGQHRGDVFGFFFSSKRFVTTYLKEQYFSKKFNLELKLFRGFQREERTEI